MTNTEIARKLRDHATELAQNGGNLYRVRSFRQAAGAIEFLATPVEDLLETHGIKALKQVPGVGVSLAETIANYAITGCWNPRTAPRGVQPSMVQTQPLGVGRARC